MLLTASRRSLDCRRLSSADKLHYRLSLDHRRLAGVEGRGVSDFAQDYERAAGVGMRQIQMGDLFDTATEQLDGAPRFRKLFVRSGPF